VRLRSAFDKFDFPLLLKQRRKIEYVLEKMKCLFKFYQKDLKGLEYLATQSFWKLNYTGRVIRTYTTCFKKPDVIFSFLMTKQFF